MRSLLLVATCLASMLAPTFAFSFGIRVLRPLSTFFAPLAHRHHCFPRTIPLSSQGPRRISHHEPKRLARPLMMQTGGVNNLLVGLNDAQKQAVTAPRGPTIVLAGPGSGKTRVLTHRIGYLLESRVRPEQIMAVTFTNKAANEMKKRIKGMLGVHKDGDLRMMVGTFHGICVRLLREFAAEAGLQSNFMIFDDKQQEKLVEEALQSLNMDPQEFSGLRFTISRLKSEGLAPKDVFKTETVAVGAEDDWRKRYLNSVKNVYTKYQELLQTNNAVDFDDLLLRIRQLLQHNAEVRTVLQDRYQHLLVDEWQDTNVVQYEIVKLLVIEPKSSSVFVVGDADQSIYGFRGADIRNVRQFIKDFDATKILLELNYRSTINIATAAQTLIENNKGRVKKDTKAFKTRGSKVQLFEADNDRHEAAFVGSEIQRLVRNEMVEGGYREMAVMYRTNRQSRTIEETLVRAGIPYTLVGGKKFYERREVRDVVAYLRILSNPCDDESLFRILNIPTRGIGKKTEEKIKELGSHLHIPCYEILDRMRKLQATKLMREEEEAAAKALQGSTERFQVEDVDEGMAQLEAALSSLSTTSSVSRLSREDQAVEALAAKLTAKQRTGLVQFAEVVEFLREIATQTTPADLIDSLLRVTQYEEFLAKTYNKPSDDITDRLENVMELKAAATLVDQEGLEGLIEFLTTVVLDRAEEEKEEIEVEEDVMKKPQVKLLTLHSSIA